MPAIAPRTLPVMAVVGISARPVQRRMSNDWMSPAPAMRHSGFFQPAVPSKAMRLPESTATDAFHDIESIDPLATSLPASVLRTVTAVSRRANAAMDIGSSTSDTLTGGTFMP